jgi:hypothetical protein
VRRGLANPNDRTLLTERSDASYRDSQICDTNLEAASDFNQRDNVVYGNAFDELSLADVTVNRPLNAIKED